MTNTYPEFHLMVIRDRKYGNFQHIVYMWQNHVDFQMTHIDSTFLRRWVSDHQRSIWLHSNSNTPHHLLSGNAPSFSFDSCPSNCWGWKLKWSQKQNTSQSLSSYLCWLAKSLLGYILFTMTTSHKEFTYQALFKYY